MDNNIYKRLSKIEAMTNLQKSALTETLETAYKNACETGDEEQASNFARAIRNRLLDESDKEMTLDRLNIDTSSTVKFIASVANIFKTDWAVYRQKLRDLPEQEGFPFDIAFPVAPPKIKS